MQSGGWLPFALFVAGASTVTSCRSTARDAPVGDPGTGCTGVASCGPDGLCDFEPGLCGHGTRPGTCRPRPTSCGDAAYAPVCGCDGKTYPSECQARAAGIDLSVNGGCRGGPPSYAPCGAHFCDVRESYCEIVLSDVVEPPTDYACKALPAGCISPDGARPDCDCFPPGTRCLSFCGPIETGGRPGLHLTCRL